MALCRLLSSGLRVMIRSEFLVSYVHPSSRAYLLFFLFSFLWDCLLSCWFTSSYSEGQTDGAVVSSAGIGKGWRKHLGMPFFYPQRSLELDLNFCYLVLCFLLSLVISLKMFSHETGSLGQCCLPFSDSSGFQHF